MGIEPITLFDAETLKKESETSSKANIIAHLKNESKNVDAIILWLDCDREGENICFEVLEICSPNLKNKQNVFRANFSINKTRNIKGYQ